jgi:two-component system sensor histidine kinase AtoS
VARKIAGAVRGLDAVVGDVLSFARELRLRPTPTDAGELLTRASDACRAEAAEVVRADLTGAAVELECDAALVHQALVNLIRNAAEANRVSGGRLVWLDAAPGPVDASDPDPVSGVVISVRDEGDGVSPEVIERVFNPFFTTRATGTGLGLSIVHRIADAHAGRVIVQNNSAQEPGARGATVELRLPVRAVQVSPEIVVRRAAGSVAEGSR